MKTIEQKAKAYDEALEKAKDMLSYKEVRKEDIEYLFPELAESEDERIRKEIVRFIQMEVEDEIVGNKWLAWLEKQGEIDKKSYEIAENEKRDFVSGQFIECRKSFNEFKEDNSYWFEYIGNDTYIGRSDNILNKKFHITPRQLYRLFTQQHCPKENNVNEETNATTAYGKYVDECLNEASKHFFSEGEDKYSVADLFYAGVKCGKSWFEKQNEQKSSTKVKPKFNIGDTMRTLQEANDDYTDGMPVVVSIDNEYYHCTNELIAIKDQDDYEFPPINVKQKPANKVEPKFKVGDWIVEPRKGEHNCIWHIDRIEKNSYWEGHVGVFIEHADKYYHLWTIADAKDGDVLISKTKHPFIFKNYDEDTDYVYAYCGITDLVKDNGFYINYEDDELWTMYCVNGDVLPATKEQRDLLFQKMRKAGYEWDAEKKGLKLLITNGGDFEQENCEQNSAWSKEDDAYQSFAISAVEDYYDAKNSIQRGLIDWLKSLKDRVGCEVNCTTMWKPSDEQIDAFKHFVKSIGESGYAYPHNHNTNPRKMSKT